MDLFEIIEGCDKTTPLKTRYKKNLPKIKKVVRALVYELPVCVVDGDKVVKVNTLLEAEEHLENALKLFETEGRVKIKIHKSYI
jgi:hypothetical protein